MTDALENVDGTSATVKTYDANGGIEEVPVTIGETYGSYTVIKDGLSDDVTCLIEMKEGFKEGAGRPERTEGDIEEREERPDSGIEKGDERLERPESNLNEGEKERGQVREEQKEGGNMNGQMEK